MGGMIAQQVAVLEPDGIRSLVLGCTTHGGPTAVSGGKEFIQTFPHSGMTEREVYEATEKLLAFNFTPEWIAANPDRFRSIVDSSLLYPRPLRGVLSQLGAIIDFDLSRQISGLRSFPTLVIHGDADKVLPLENGKSIAKLIPNSILFPLRGVGHIFWDMDNGVSAVRVRQFFREHDDPNPSSPAPSCPFRPASKL